MALSTEERIIRLKRGIASSETTDALRAIMQADLDELLNPPIVQARPVAATPKPAAKKPVKPKEKPKAAPKVEPPPPSGPTPEEKERLKAEYAARRAKKKEKENQ